MEICQKRKPKGTFPPFSPSIPTVPYCVLLESTLIRLKLDSNVYSAAWHIPLQRLNLSALIVPLLSKKTPREMKRHERQSAAPWWETWAVLPEESHNGPDESVKAARERRWGPSGWGLGQALISLVPGNLLNEKIALNQFKLFQYQTNRISHHQVRISLQDLLSHHKTNEV